MMFRYTPKVYRRALRILNFLAYLFVLYAGVSALVWTPTTVAGAMGSLSTKVWPVVTIFGAVGAIVGVVRGEWRVERWTVPIATGGLASYVITTWVLVATSTVTRQTQASVVTIALIMLINQSVRLFAQAAADRAEHEVKQAHDKE